MGSDQSDERNLYQAYTQPSKAKLENPVGSENSFFRDNELVV